MFGSPLTSMRSPLRAAVPLALLVLAATLSSPPASASPGYELNPVKPSLALTGQVPIGVAVDQASQVLYVAEVSKDLSALDPGQVEQLDVNGEPTANSPFVVGGEDRFSAVAVNPVTHDIYAYQTEVSTPVGVLGISRMNIFSSTGTMGAFFSPSKSEAAQIAADSAGRVYYPNSFSGTVQVFDSSGALKDTITCSGCPGGTFVEPHSVAIDSADNIYVTDQASAGRAIKLSPSAGTYVFSSVLQSGEGAIMVGVDPASNDVFVGDQAGGVFHIAAYNSSGVRFDDFGAELVTAPPFSRRDPGGGIAVNATTHKVYLSDPGHDKIWVFDRVASIQAPTASTDPPSPIGQLEATFKATVNPKGHTLTSCRFDYTTDADFQANGYANAVSAPCSSKPGKSASTPVKAQVTGLSPGTKYDYRVVVASYGGGAEDGDQAFETLPPLAPGVTTGSAFGIAQTSATLAGSVNPKGGPISDCHFEYTDEAHFQEEGFTGASLKACSPSPSGTTDNSVSAAVSGLIAATGYRFRVVATNNSGTAKAVEKAFTTLAETCQTNPALCPPPPVNPPPTLPPAQLPTVPPVTTPAKKPLRCRKGFRKKRVHGKAKCVRVKKRGARKHSRR